MRAFLAIPILDVNLLEILRKLTTNYSSIDWVKPENLHLTLHFFADIDLTTVQLISSMMSHLVKNHFVFNIEYQDTLLLPSNTSPKSLAYAINKSSELMQLVTNIKIVLNTHGFKSEHRKFIPHVTLGRIKSTNFDIPQLPKLKINSPVTEIILFQSVSENIDVIYKPLASFHLN